MPRRFTNVSREQLEIDQRLVGPGLAAPNFSNSQWSYSGSLKPRWMVQFYLGFFQDKEPVVVGAWGSLLIP